MEEFCNQNPYHEICGYGGGGMSGMLTCPYTGATVSRPEDCPEFSGGSQGGGGCANTYSGNCGSDDDDEEEEEVDQTPGCWGDLVAGETVVTSGFQTPSRPDHNGVDLRCPTGTNVHAAEAGTVTRIPNENMAEGTFVERGQPGSGGNMIEVTYDSGRAARFMHLLPRDRDGILVQVDQSVAAGELLGACNDTGHSYAPHLHYDLKENDSFVDPVQGHDCE